MTYDVEREISAQPTAMRRGDRRKHSRAL